MEDLNATKLRRGFRICNKGDLSLAFVVGLMVGFHVHNLKV